MRRSWALACSLISVSRAAPAAPDLRWAGPECGDAQPTFESKLAALVAPSDRAQLSGQVSIERRGAALSVTLSLELGEKPLGERRIEVKTCAAAAETAAVAASLAVFSGAEASSPPAPEANPVAPFEREPSPRPEPPPPPAPARVSPELRAGLLATVDGRALPALAPGAAVEVGLGLGRFSAAISGGATLAQDHALDAAESARLRLWSGQVRGCYAALRAEPVRFDTCVGLRGLWMRGQGQGFAVNRDGSLSALAPALELDISLRVPPPIEWRFELEAAVPLARPRFVVRSREAAQLEAVTWAARLGPMLRF